MIEIGKMTEKNLKTATYAGIAAFIVLALIVFIAPNVKTLLDRKKQYEAKIVELQNTEAKLAKVEAEYQTAKAQVEKYMADLAEIRKRFTDASLKDETHLKILVQTLINVLKLEMLSTGKTEEEASTQGYSKKIIPYKVRGDFDQISRFFHYLENSKWLISFKSSELNMQGVKQTYKYNDKEYDVDKVEVSFKAGAYYVKNPDALFKPEKPVEGGVKK